jgi:broad specificity phosphatase PhoE
MELYLIRHGESTNNALPDDSQRVADPLLTPLGERQAERVAAFIEARAHLHPTQRNGAAPLDRLYCSAMLRAMQTADAIGRRIGLAPEVWLDVHEFGGIYLDHGARRVGYPGGTRGELAQRFPHFLRMTDVGETGWWNRPHEERAEGVQRALRVAQTLRERAHETTRVGIVSHGDFLSSLMHALLVQDDGAVYYDHHNTGVTCVELTPQIVRVRYLNRADHLDGEFG